MPRSSWSSRPTPVKPIAHRPAPAPPTTPTPPTSSVPQQTVTHNVNIERPGFFANAWQGFGLGAGQAIAHNIFRSSATAASAPSAPAAPPSSDLPKEFIQCMKDNHNDLELCKQFIDKQ